MNVRAHDSGAECVERKCVEQVRYKSGEDHHEGHTPPDAHRVLHDNDVGLRHSMPVRSRKFTCAKRQYHGKPEKEGPFEDGNGMIFFHERFYQYQVSAPGNRVDENKKITEKGSLLVAAAKVLVNEVGRSAKTYDDAGRTNEGDPFFKDDAGDDEHQDGRSDHHDGRIDGTGEVQAF